MVALIPVNVHTKFEMSSFIRSKNITGAPKFRNAGARDLDHDHLGTTMIISRLTLHMINFYTKFEVLALAIPEIFQQLENSKVRIT